MDALSVAVYVPTKAAAAKLEFIATGSGIVGKQRGAWVDLWYEGNLYQAENLNRWVERVACAAGRMGENYPTRARAVVPAEWVQQVGWYEAETSSVIVENLEAVSSWSGEAIGQVERTRVGALKHSISDRYSMFEHLATR
jgi:hypothetical protein